MIAALVIVFREVLEAALVVGVVLAATRGLAGSRRWISFGIVGGLIGAALVARFAGALTDALEGYGQEIFNAAILLVAVAMLIWHNAWMASHGKQMASELRGVGDAVRAGDRPLYALAIVVGAAVLREGSETVLFLYGLAASDGGMTTALSGGAVGLLAGAAAGAALYLGLLRIPTRYLFKVTGWMIALLAAGMAAQATVLLSAADLMPLGPTLWDTSWLLREDSILGKVLHILVGYVAEPTEAQLGAYLITLGIIFAANAMAGRAMARASGSPAAGR